MIACTPRSWTRVSRIMDSVADRATRQVMIAGTVGSAAAAEFALLADEIAATVGMDEMLATPRADRMALYPASLHGLTALVFGLVGMVTRGPLAAAIEILADLRTHRGLATGGLPTRGLARFGFELLIGRALAQGWQDVFATSEAYAAYAADRRALGLP